MEPFSVAVINLSLVVLAIAIGVRVLRQAASTPNVTPARRENRRVRASVRSVMVLCGLLGGAAQAQDDAALWQRIRSEPRIVIAMRHAETTRGDPLAFDASGACRDEIVLTPKGRTDAGSVGKHFAERQIKPVVITSPMCRCSETAELAFGTRGISDPALREVASASGPRFQEFLAEASSLLKRHAGNTAIVFISHMPNIDALSGEQIGYGVGLVGRVSPEGDIDPIGRIKLY